ncbi:MAG: glycosyltransferase family 1 protein [Prevotella sp.]
MKILLIGEYSSVHWTLAEGLRHLGHKVTVLSNGDFWKDYPTDICLKRKPTKLGGMAYMAKLYAMLPRLRGYDVVQLINPMFLELKAERLFPIYSYLRKHNGRMVLGAFGMDYYWVHVCSTEKPLRYSDFNMGTQLRTDEDALKEQADWLGTEKERLNRLVAEDCDGIVCGLYEYYACYKPYFADKMRFIPYPVKPCEQSCAEPLEDRKIRLFIGINKNRSVYKGTDIMLDAAEEVVARHKDRVELVKAESVPFADYMKMMEGSDAILDQLYSYTPAMNALQAMSKGIVCVGGGEPENYEILGERELRPIINVEPTRESVVKALEQFVAHPGRIPAMKQDSVAYIRRHHDYIKVARQYEDFYLWLGKSR